MAKPRNKPTTRADDLQYLLDMLSIQANYQLSRTIVLAVQYKMPGQPLAPQHQNAISSFREHVKNSLSMQQSGLLDFELGLRYFKGRHFEDSGQHFAFALSDWIHTADSSLISLVYLAIAIVWHSLGEAENAARGYGRARRQFILLRKDPSRLSVRHPGNRKQFLEAYARFLENDIIEFVDIPFYKERLRLETEYFMLVDIFDPIQSLPYDLPLPVRLARDIEDCRKVIYDSERLDQTGLFHFDVGLAFLNARRFQEAVDHLQTALRQWQLIGDWALIALASYGHCAALFFCEDFTQEAVGLLMIKNHIEELRLSGGILGPEAAHRRVKFASSIEQATDWMLTMLKETRKPIGGAPVIAAALAGTPSGMTPVTLAFKYVNVHQLSSFELQSKILSIFNALVTLNKVAAKIWRYDEVSPVEIRSISDDGDIELRFTGLSTVVKQAVVRVLEDSRHRDRSESLDQEYAAHLLATLAPGDVSTKSVENQAEVCLPHIEMISEEVIAGSLELLD